MVSSARTYVAHFSGTYLRKVRLTIFGIDSRLYFLPLFLLLHDRCYLDSLSVLLDELAEGVEDVACFHKFYRYTLGDNGLEQMGKQSTISVSCVQKRVYNFFTRFAAFGTFGTYFMREFARFTYGINVYVIGHFFGSPLSHIVFRRNCNDGIFRG